MKKHNEVELEINGRRQKVSGLSDEVVALLASDKYTSGCYTVSDFIDHSWQPPDTPLQMEVELDYIHPDDRQQIRQELGLDGETEVLEFYVERTGGAVQSIMINEQRFETVSDLPDGVVGFLDGLVFGDPADPVVTGSGERISFWDVVRGAPEVQQAFYEYGYQNTEAGLTLHGEFDVRHSLHALDTDQEKRLAETVSRGATHVEINRKQAAKRKRLAGMVAGMRAALYRLSKVAFVLIVLTALVIAGLDYFPEFF